jgi:hypothetical protein
MIDSKLRELAEFYGIEIHEVPPGEGGLYWNDKKIPQEEVFEFLFGINMNEVQNYETGNATKRKNCCNEK